MKLEPGTNLGPYRIISELGRGGMATVYKAHQAALSRMVAVKVLPEYSAGEPGFKERFQQEAVAVANLRHPNIPPVYDYGETDGIVYIVGEYIDGGTLTEQLGKPLPVEYAVAILTPIASALDYAHSQGVLHRDVKPSNVLMERDGTPKLADFGLAKMMGAGRNSLTGTGMIVGTPQYMAPEQCEGQELSPAADLYALGVVAYEMLTGRPPFVAETPLAVMLAQVTSALPLPRQLNPDLSELVEAVLLKALAKQPGDRYAACTRFVRALSEAAAARAPVHPTFKQTSASSESPTVGIDPPVGPIVRMPPRATPASIPTTVVEGVAIPEAAPLTPVQPAAPLPADEPVAVGRRGSNPLGTGLSRVAHVFKARPVLLLPAVALALAVSILIGLALQGGVGSNSTPSSALNGSPSPVSSPTALAVQSVMFTGNAAAPLITVTGVNFGAEPNGSPAQCGGTRTYSGAVYGDDLYFLDADNVFGQGTSAQGSCVGIIVTNWSSTGFTFQFGDAYHTQDHWYIASGDSYTLMLKGTKFRGTVAFG